MNNKWYLLINGQVQGPFPEGELELKAENIKDVLIWGKGLSEWVSLPIWRSDRVQLAQAAELEKNTFKEVMWRYKHGGTTSQWIAQSQLLQTLKQLKDLNQVVMCNDVTKMDSADSSIHWGDVYAFPELVDLLGITRRAHPRVPIMGTLDVELPGGAEVFRVISISEGGLGVTDTKNISIGQKFKSHLKSPNLYLTINCTCEIVYLGQDGYAGIKFQNLNSEYHSAIVEYVKKFSELKML